MSVVSPRTASGSPVAIVTGGSRGIGRAIATRLAQEGYDIVIAFRENSAAADKVVTAITESGQACVAVKADIRNANEVRCLFKETQQHFGRLDVLVNNAGVLYEALFQMTSDARLRDVFETNVFAAFNCMKAAIPLMLRRRCGTIVNVSSTASRGVPGLSVYGASKAALDGLTCSVAREVARHGIRVLGVAPSWTETDMVDASAQGRTLPAAKSAMQRPASADEIAAVVAAIIRPDLTYLSGQTIAVNGGGML